MGIRREEKIEQTVGVYVHIPYCTQKCYYCDFNSLPSVRVPEKRYSDCVTKELSTLTRKKEFSKRWRSVESIYFGGGTPSLLSPDSIASMIGGIKAAFRKPPHSNEEVPEVTLEANPETMDPEKLEGYRRAGVGRLSLGVQSFKDEHLKAIGRCHSAEKALEAFKTARAAGFESIGVDLVYGLPGQSLADWDESLERVEELRPEHVSIYALTIEKGTRFDELLKKGELPLPTDAEVLDMYWRGVGLLKGLGYVHYEISNLALPGFSSRQNSRYWHGGDYIGLGAGAHSYVRSPGWGRRWWNAPGPAHYMRMVETTGNACTGSETLGKQQAALESVFLGLRTLKGINTAAFKKRFGIHPKEAMDWARVSGRGLVRTDGENVRLTPRGIAFSNEVF